MSAALKSKKTKIQIMKMAKSDAARVSQLSERCGLGFWSVEDYQNEAERIGGYAVIARLNGKIVGFLVSRLITTCMNPSSLNENGNKLEAEFEIYNIAVAPEHRRNGVAGEMLRALFIYITNRKWQKTSIWLEVRESNARAVSFYENHGFTHHGIRKKFYNNPVENAYVMKIEILTVN